MAKRKFYMLLLTLLISISIFSEKIELVTFEFPPYEYNEGGQAKGFVVEIVTEAFKRMGKEVDIKVYPWVRALYNIKKGDSDAIFTAYKNSEREKFADYSEEILMEQTVSLFVSANSRISYDGDLSKLRRNTFGVTRGMSYGEKFDEAAKDGTLENLDKVALLELNFKKLAVQRVDIVPSNKYIGMNLIRKNKLQNKIRELEIPVQKVPSYIAFSKKRNLGELRDQFDKTIKEMRADGTYKEIIDEYMSNK